MILSYNHKLKKCLIIYTLKKPLYHTLEQILEVKKWYNDLRSDNAVLWGFEKQGKRFKNAQSH